MQIDPQKYYYVAEFVTMGNVPNPMTTRALSYKCMGSRILEDGFTDTGEFLIEQQMGVNLLVTISEYDLHGLDKCMNQSVIIGPCGIRNRAKILDLLPMVIMLREQNDPTTTMQRRYETVDGETYIDADLNYQDFPVDGPWRDGGFYAHTLVFLSNAVTAFGGTLVNAHRETVSTIKLRVKLTK